MFGLGLVMFVVAAVMTFIYYNKVKSSDPQSLTERNQLAAQKAAALRAQTENKELEIQNVKKGGVVHLEGVGLEMASMDLQITGRHMIKEGGSRSFELEGTTGSDTVYLSIEDDEIYVTLASPSLAEVGLNPGDLDQLRVDQGKSIEYRGDSYQLASIGVAAFCKNSNELESESFEHWEFGCADGEQSLSISRWSDGSSEVSYSVPVKPTQIVVYSIA